MDKFDFKVLLCLLALSFVSTECLAQNKATKGEEKKMTVVGKISPVKYKAIVKSMTEAKSNVPTVEFKVAAIVTSLCVIGFDGEIECPPTSTTRRCPESIKVQLPGGQLADLKLNCVGPDADGNCECEAAN